MAKKIKSVQLTNLGNRELRQHHSVRIEGGNVPRAQVMDQTIIDRFLMHGLIDLGQHRAAEYLLRQAAKAGIWPTGINWGGAGSTGGKRNYVPFGAFPYGRTLVLVRRRYGHYHAYLVQEVVCYDWDVSGSAYKMGCLRDSLDLIADRKIRGKFTPMDRLKFAAQKKGHSQVVAVPDPGGG